MKKYLLILLSLFLLTTITGCDKEEIRTIKIYNCVDYIDETVLDKFVEYYYETYGEEIAYIYDTYETNESMYNTLRTGKTSYDLCCPSDYMIQKLIKEDRLEKFDFVNYDLDNYFANCSPYIKRLYEENGWTDYAACYMWGTLGVIYNPSMLAEAAGLEDYELTSWNDFNNPDFKGMGSIKDSVRDSYCVAQILINQDDLKKVPNTSKEYNSLIQNVINKVTDEDISNAFAELRNLKDNIYGLEVDSGKGDIVTGKIAMNLAWSGDAVYSIDLAEDEDIELRYTVPTEGGNVWFDGWCMPKGADKELAQEFINFLSNPEIAAQNMEMIGYTSSIAGEAIYTLIDEWYGEASNELYVEETLETLNAFKEEIKEKEASGKYKEKQRKKDQEKLLELEEEYLEALAYLDEASYTLMDVTYFFDGTLSDEYYSEDNRIYVSIDDSYIGRQFTTQYPDEDTLNRCGVMQDFGDQNELVLQMWIDVKANKASTFIYVFLASFAVGGLLVYFTSKRSYFARIRRLKKK